MIISNQQLQLLALKKQAGIANAALAQGKDAGPALKEIARIANSLLPVSKEKAPTSSRKKSTKKD